MNCFHCQKSIESSKISIGEYCPHCGHDLHSCVNCNFYDRAFNNSCRENQAERVVDKEKKNFCDYFHLGEREMRIDQKEDLFSAAEALFKKNGSKT